MRSPGNGTAPPQLFHGLDTQVLARVTPDSRARDAVDLKVIVQNSLVGTFWLLAEDKNILSGMIAQPLSRCSSERGFWGCALTNQLHVQHTRARNTGKSKPLPLT